MRSSTTSEATASRRRPYADSVPAARRTLARLNARVWGVSVGLVAGLMLFLATNILILRGGEVVGPHLALLGLLLPGYRVTFVGSLIGFVYAFVIGYAIGRLIGVVYNAVTDRR